MNFIEVFGKARRLMDRAGGPGAVKHDVEGVTGAMGHDGNFADKAKDAYSAVEKPGGGTAHGHPERPRERF